MVEVRDATPGDASAIATVHVESWQAGYRGLLPDDVLDGLSVADRALWWRHTLADPGRRATLLLTDGDAVLGFAAFGPDRGDDPLVGELYALYLRPSSWGCRLGGRLHAEVLARLRALGYRRVELWMLAGNERALRFYRRQGWTVDGRARRVAGPGGVELEHRGLTRPLEHLITDGVFSARPRC